MRKLLVSEMVTLDGFFEGPNREIDWHMVDGDFNDFAIQQLNSVDLLIFGRVTYQLMVDYWPSPAATTDDPIVADKMNTLPKVVFSNTLKSAPWGRWNNARLATNSLADEISTLKQQPGKDMVIFGSGTLVAALTQLGLIDEYRIFVNPVILGSGKPLFGGIDASCKLKLASTNPFKSGVVQLNYSPDK